MSPKNTRATGQRGRPGPKRKVLHKKRAEVAEVGEGVDEDDFVDPEGDTDEEAWTSEATDSLDEEGTDPGNE